MVIDDITNQYVAPTNDDGRLVLINKTVTLAVEKGLIKSGTIIVDATHTASRSNPYSPVDILKQRSKLLRKAIYLIDEDQKDKLPQKNEDDVLENELSYTESLIKYLTDTPVLSEIPAVKEKMNLLSEAVDDIRDHYNTSKDRDARVGHKSADDAFFGYKISGKKVRSGAERSSSFAMPEARDFSSRYSDTGLSGSTILTALPERRKNSVSRRSSAS